MPGFLSNFTLHKMLDLTLRATAYTPPASVWLTFATGNIQPNDASITEWTIATGAYARRQITFGAAAYREMFNTAAIVFPTPTADWITGPALWAVIMDSATLNSNNWLWACPMCALTIRNGDQPPNIPVSKLKLSLALPNMSTYLANKWLDHLFRNTAFTAPSSVNLAFGKAVQSWEDATVISEVSGGAYARQAITFAAAVDATAMNSAAIAFPTAAGAAWSTAAAPILSEVICDQGTNPLFFAPCCPKVISDGDVGPTYAIDALRVRAKF